MPRQVFIRCLGLPLVQIDGEDGNHPIPKSALQLLVYLGSREERRVLREEIYEALWPDIEPAKAASRLTSALWRLRKALRGLGHDQAIVTEPSGALRLIHSPDFVLDTAELRRAARSFLSDPGQLHAPAALTDEDRFATPYRGWYAPWALRDRARLENLQEKCLRVSLGRLVDAGETACALDVAHRLLRIDPLLEDVYEQEIDILIGLGQSTKARRKFEECRTVLMRELDVAPGERLSAKIRDLMNSPLVPGSPAAPASAEARQLLGDAQRDLRKLSELLSCRS